MMRYRRIMTGPEIRHARGWFYSFADYRALAAGAVIYLLMRML